MREAEGGGSDDLSRFRSHQTENLLIQTNGRANSHSVCLHKQQMYTCILKNSVMGLIINVNGSS